MQIVFSARKARHPVYGHTVYWGECHIDGKLKSGIGPYRHKEEAIQGAKEHAGQLQIPGCEPISQKQLVERKFAEPLRAVASQKPCDIGLFSDDAAQIDLIEMLMDPVNE